MNIVWFMLDFPPLVQVEENIEVTPGVDQVPGDSVSQLETSRRIDAGVLSFKHVLIAALILLIAAAASQFFSR